MTDHARVRKELRVLIENALGEAETPEHLLDVAAAAAAVGDPGLMGLVADRVASEIADAVTISSSWELQASYSKVGVWEHTGQAARLLAEAYALVAPEA